MNERLKKHFWTVEEAAEALGIGRSLAYKAVQRGEIPSVRIGRRVLVPTDAPERMLRNEASLSPGELREVS